MSLAELFSAKPRRRPRLAGATRKPARPTFMESLENRILLSGVPLEPELVQTASSVLDFSSQYSPTSWSAAQTLGTPDTSAYGDIPTAWAPAQQNGAPASITVGFETPVHASGVTVRETWGNGFVTRIELLDVADTLHTVWTGVDPSQPGSPVDFTVSFDPTVFATKGVRVTTDTNHNLTTWEEIDSIQLAGTRATAVAGPAPIVQGSIDTPGETDRYTFTLDQDRNLYFDSITSPGFTWSLTGPRGAVVSGRDFRGPYTLFLEGRYFVSGATAFTFNVQPVTDDTVPLTLGARVDGAIGHAGQADRYTFTLTDSRQLYFDSLSESNLVWSLSGPRGTVVSGRDFRGSDSRDFGGNPVLDLVAGDYTLTIDAAGETTGSYAFRVFDLAQGPSLTPGTPVAGVLDPANATAVYHLTAAAGDRFFFDMQSLANNDVEWRLLSPYGDEIFEDWMGRDFPETTLNAPGIYTLLVEGRRYATGT